MNKRILLGLLVLVLVLTAVGVFAASSYKTTVSTSPISTTANGDYILKVKVLMNYGPFGGVSPLGDADVWLYYYNGSAYVYHEMNFTASNGVATFVLPKGDYKILITDLHYTYTFSLSGSEEITVSYAYLYR
ncbi:hypothetical protein [Sulfuracidifex tepidarius]|uniref:Uncharacterized protein n=1 Tax=Sulfuracidifex tepidarius TaxID=1294262 RepID=A0A510DV57_9CREN|nr:hypothetical protein [Sulfuracidifex tepidarius]BBG24067.1 hypothetical protein IC006_1368 [Sulfuracidifex tepidarius]BBG26822.1 hypothetical protein IC007_1343 [Sulfuracidifex tepidarius]